MSPLVLFFSALSMVAMGFFVMLGVIVAYALVTGQLGQTHPLALAGVVAVSVLPLYLAFASWRAISHKLASAEGG